MEACEIISHIFYVLLALFAWNLDPYFLSPPVLGSHLPPVRCDSPRLLLDEFRFFYVKSGTRSSPRSFSLGNLNIISTSSIWQFRVRPVYGAFGRISHIFNVTVDSDFPAQFALENLGHYFYLQSYGGGRGFLGGSDAFFALLRVVPELSASFWSPRW